MMVFIKSDVIQNIVALSKGMWLHYGQFERVYLSNVCDNFILALLFNSDKHYMHHNLDKTSRLLWVMIFNHIELVDIWIRSFIILVILIIIMYMSSILIVKIRALIQYKDVILPV